MTPHGNDAYTLHYSDHVIAEDIAELSLSAKNLIKRAIEERLVSNPLLHGKPLRHSWRGHRWLRVCDWRVIYRVDEAAKSVYIVAFGHRRDSYDE